MFNLSIHGTILRFYLMMLITIGVVFSGQTWLVVLTMIAALSAILGIRIDWKKKESGKVVRLKGAAPDQQRKAG